MAIRAIVGRFSFDCSHAVIEDVLRRHPFDFCAIISTGNPPYYESLPRDRQEWFFSTDIRSCYYAGVDWSSLLPLDEPLIEQMRGCEAVFLDIVSRLEWKAAIPYEVRKEWYFRHLRFWNDYLSRHQINLYISAWVPHEIPDIILYDLCKLRGIPVFYFNDAMVQDTCFLESDWEEASLPLRDRYEKLLAATPADTPPESIPLPPRFEHVFSALSRPKGEPGDFFKVTYWQTVRRLLWQKPLLFTKYVLAYCTPAGVARAFGTFQRWRALKIRKAFYDAHAAPPDLAKRFVYMPLHYQPEASTTPMSGCYADQVVMAQLLSAHLPEDAFIYVKEHPWESGWLKRSVRYYESFLEIPKVRFVPRNFDTFLLREHCMAVATGTGSAGFEALFRGKPVLLFGHRFYQYARGVFQIHSSDDCKKAMEAVLKGEAATPLQSRLFLKAMEETSIHGALDPFLLRKMQVTPEENTRAFSDVILRELETIFQ